MKDIQGIQRGKCNSCECEEYRAPVESGRLRCEYCNHTPGEHVKIIELGACRSCGQDDCDKYVSEDPNSYTDCQYCGCSANSHAGAEACELITCYYMNIPLQNYERHSTLTVHMNAWLFPHAVRKPKPVQPGGTVPVTAVAGTSNIPANFPQPPGIQPRMTADGKVAQTSVLGKCALPECPYPRSVEANRVHDYCSRTCAQKHATQKQQGRYTLLIRLFLNSIVIITILYYVSP